MEKAFHHTAIFTLCLVLMPGTLWADDARSALKRARATSRMIDARLDKAQREANVTATNKANAHVLIRRLSLDLNGIIPSSADIKKYARSKSLEAYIEARLSDPRYGLHFSNVLTRAFVGRRRDNNAAFFRDWLGKELEKERSFQKIAQELIRGTPKGRSDAGNGQAFFNRRWGPKPEEIAAQSARVFMGLQIQCAQCHDHPFNKWRQQQFHGYAAFFTETNYRYKLKGSSAPSSFAPRFLFPLEKPSSLTRRDAVAKLTTAKENPYFAKAIVNRIWFSLMGRGLVEPVEDLESSPGRFPQLLEFLAADFIANDFQVKHLVRSIVFTKAYSRNSRRLSLGRKKVPSKDLEENQQDRLLRFSEEETLFARFTIRPLSPEQIVDSLLRATGREALSYKGGAKTRKLAKIRFDYLKEKLQGQFEQLYDDSEGQADLFQGTIPQTLILLNGSFINEAIEAEDGTFMERLARSSGSRKILLQRLFVQTLSRPPSKAEQSTLAPLLGPRDTRMTIAEDLMWALLNSSEWLLNH
ncbi:MAG: DUF1553 domain-containing protein [Planctomycetota bacterium]|nr:DUF1553 domain-containing protein [Planctomycetota bacterium]